MSRALLQNDHCGYCVEDGLEVDQTGSMEFGEEAERDKRGWSKVRGARQEGLE